MNCNDARALIHAYADGELGLESALEIERHLEPCAGCTREREAIATLSTALGDRALRFAAPDALRRRVGAALAGEAAVTARAPWWRLRWLGGWHLEVASGCPEACHRYPKRSAEHPYRYYTVKTPCLDERRLGVMSRGRPEIPAAKE